MYVGQLCVMFDVVLVPSAFSLNLLPGEDFADPARDL